MEIEKITLLIKDPYLFVRYQLTQWYLHHLFVPCTLAQLGDQYFEVLDLQVASSTTATGKKTQYEVTGETEIVTIANGYRVVMLLDHSSSMRTVENKVLSSIAFETYFFL
jgi:hypothetical protein